MYCRCATWWTPRSFYQKTPSVQCYLWLFRYHVRPEEQGDQAGCSSWAGWIYYKQQGSYHRTYISRSYFNGKHFLSYPTFERITIIILRIPPAVYLNINDKQVITRWRICFVTSILNSNDPYIHSNTYLPLTFLFLPVFHQSIPHYPPSSQPNWWRVRPRRRWACSWGGMATPSNCLRVFSSLHWIPRFQHQHCQEVHRPALYPPGEQDLLKIILKNMEKYWTTFL